MPRTQDAIVRAREPTVLDLTLARPGTIRGLVCDPREDAALEGVDVVLRQPDGSRLHAQTGSDGTFAFEGLPPATYLVTVIPPVGYTGTETQQTIALAPKQTVDVDFELAPGGVVRGRVVDEHTGEPLADVPVVLLDSSGHAFRRARTTATGEYEFVNLPEDKYRVSVESES